MPDAALFEFLHGLANRFTALDFLGIFFAQYLPYLLAVWFLVLLALTPDWKNRFYMFALAFVSVVFARGIIAEIIRFFYDRSRPFAALDFSPLITPLSGPSFPSSHATVFFTLATALYFTRRRASLWFYAAAVLIGAARVFAGVHWPSDILGGAAVGIVSVMLIRGILPKVETAKSSAVDAAQA